LLVSEDKIYPMIDVSGNGFRFESLTVMYNELVRVIFAPQRELHVMNSVAWSSVGGLGNS